MGCENKPCTVVTGKVDKDDFPRRVEFLEAETTTLEWASGKTVANSTETFQPDKIPNNLMGELLKRMVEEGYPADPGQCEPGCVCVLPEKPEAIGTETKELTEELTFEYWDELYVSDVEDPRNMDIDKLLNGAIIDRHGRRVTYDPLIHKISDTCGDYCTPRVNYTLFSIRKRAKVKFRATVTLTSWAGTCKAIPEKTGLMIERDGHFFVGIRREVLKGIEPESVLRDFWRWLKGLF